MRTKKEVIDFLEKLVGTTVVCKGNASLNGQCVSLIKSLMEFLGAPNPYKARGHAKSCISAYLSEGIAKPGIGFLSVFSNKNMAGSYGHIWCNAGDGNGTYYESNGQKPLIVTKGKTYSYDMVCNFDQYINLTESQNTQKTYTQEEWDKLRAENQDNWDKWKAETLTTAGLKEQLKLAQDKHQKLIEYIITKIAPLRAFIDQSEESAKGAIVELVSLVDTLNKTISDNKKQAEKKEQELVKKNEDLQSKLDTLQAQFDKLKEDHARELETMQNRIDKVQEQVEANSKEVAENNKFKQFIKDFITKILKG